MIGEQSEDRYTGEGRTDLTSPGCSSTESAILLEEKSLKRVLATLVEEVREEEEDLSNHPADGCV